MGFVGTDQGYDPGLKLGFARGLNILSMRPLKFPSSQKKVVLTTYFEFWLNPQTQAPKTPKMELANPGSSISRGLIFRLFTGTVCRDLRSI